MVINMKKSLFNLVALILVACMILPIASCAETPTVTETTDTTETTETQTLGIAETSSQETVDSQSESGTSCTEQETDSESESTLSSKIETTEAITAAEETDSVSSTTTESAELSEATVSETDAVTEKPYFSVDALPTGDGYTWKESVNNLSGNWNPHTYQTSYEKYPLQYITSGLYAFYYNDEVNYKTESGLDPFTGYVAVPEMASEMPVDITEQVKGEHPEFMIPDGATEGYAYKISLNQSVAWQNGEKITAEDYVYSMAQLLDPELNNYRAGEYFVIANSEAYFRQGTIKYLDNGIENKYSIGSLIKGDDGNYYTEDGNAMYIAVCYGIDWLGKNSLKTYIDYYKDTYFDITDWDKLTAADRGDGLVPLNDETYAWLLTTITGNKYWGETESDALNYLIEAVDYEDNYGFSGVGLYAVSEYEIVIVFNEAISGFELIDFLTEGWLVYKPYYEACKTEQNGAIINHYGTAVSNTMSYGPYKLTSYSKNNCMVFEKNESWYGYTDGKHIYVDQRDGKTYSMYETTRIDCRLNGDPHTEKQAFLCGHSMSYTLKSSDFAKYRSSDRAYFTPSATVFFMLLNGRMEIIQEREAHETFDTAQYDIESLTLKSFRQAMALTFDTEAFAAEVTPSRRGGCGLIGSAYIYNTETGEKYRDTDEAKRVLCEFYGVDPSDFESVDAAFDSISYCDYEKAGALFTQAFYEAIEAGYITDNDGDGISDQTVRLEYVASATSDFMKRVLAFLNNELIKATEGTPFEGKIIICESVPFGSSWIGPIKAGIIDLVMGGWSGDLLDPYALADNYTNPQKQYDVKWFDATAVSLTLNIEGEEITMNLREWSQALNGTAVTVNGREYSFGEGFAVPEVRLEILAALENAIMSTYYTYIPMLQDGSISLLSHQVYFVTDEYSPVMEYGGLAYIRYNYNDSEWAEYVASCGGILNY